MSAASSRLAALLVAAAAVAGVAGCGEPPRAEVDVLFGDCSPSFRDRSKAFEDEMVAVAQSSARRDRQLYAGCVDGAPLRTLEWQVDVDFKAVGEAAGGGSTGEEVKVAYAQGLGPELVEMLEWRRRVRGSGQLAALEVAAGIPGLRRVWMFSDGIVRRVAGLNLETATTADLEAAATEWAERYGGGLEGVTVTFVGGGLGAPSSSLARKARMLFELVVGRAGGVLAWSRASPFPEGDS